MKRFAFLMIVTVSLLVVFPGPTKAASPKKLGTFGYWHTYVLYEGKDPVCYMTLTADPPHKKGKENQRSNVVLMITHRPAESSFDVVSYKAGAQFKSSTDVVVRADGKKFHLFTKNDTAWARDSATDQALTLALRKDLNAVVTGQLASKSKIADNVNLKGSNAAYKQISKACTAPIVSLP